MKREHYNLIKLQIELFDLNCYDFDVEELDVKDLELNSIIYNIKQYMDNTDYNDISKDEKEILNKITVELYKLN